MTIDFYGEKFHRYEYWNLKPYIGYFTPEGKLVDFNNPVGGSHNNPANIVSWTFLLWIKQSNAFKDLDIQNFKIQYKLNVDTGIISGGSELGTSKYYQENNLMQLQKDLIEFLKIAESDKNFISRIKDRIDISKFPNYVKKGQEFPLYYGGKDGQESIYETESLFGCYNTKELLLFLKDICIQYLGYDGIEQFKTNGELPFFKNTRPWFYYPEEYYNYLENPRIISTTNNNINERFYNYLLMDWNIQRVPRMFWNEQEKRFIEENPMRGYYQTEKEIILGKEIESIRKKVPKQYRKEFFRK